MPSTILITGGTGFIGRRLVTALAKRDSRIRLLARRVVPQVRDSREEVVCGDLSDSNSALAAVAGAQVVIHLAAAMSGGRPAHEASTIEGTRNLLSACNEHGVEHFIHISSLNVYHAGSYRDGVEIDEDFPLEIMSERRGLYSWAKLQAEKLVVENASSQGLRTTVLRPGLVYGEGPRLLPRDVVLLLAGRFGVIPGGGNRRLPLVHVDNLVDAILRAWSRSEGACKIYNVVDDEQPTQREFLRLYNRYSPKKIAALPIPMMLINWLFALADVCGRGKHHYSYRVQAISRSPVFTSERIKKELGWKQALLLEQFLEQAFSAQRNFPKG